MLPHFSGDVMREDLALGLSSSQFSKLMKHSLTPACLDVREPVGSGSGLKLVFSACNGYLFKTE